MSESLAWEKWSTFSHNHNRYVEEAERFSRPGSVAQKKAFFEAHYKKLAAQKAAAAANSASSQTQQEHEEAEVDDIINTHNSQITSPKSELLVVSEENAATRSNVFKTTLPQSNKVEGAQAEKEHQAFVGKSMIVKVQNQLEGVDNNAHKEPSDKVCNQLLLLLLLRYNKNRYWLGYMLLPRSFYFLVGTCFTSHVFFSAKTILFVGFFFTAYVRKKPVILYRTGPLAIGHTKTECNSVDFLARNLFTLLII